MVTGAWIYNPLATSDDDVIDDNTTLPQRYTRRQRRLRILIGSCLLIAFLVSIFALNHFYGGRLFRTQSSAIGPSHCREPALRREWRTLNSAEQDVYIIAIQCLMHHPSIFQAGTVLYDDFTFAHSKAGSYSHYVAAFLPWHRLFIHAYEQTLRKKCDYKGALPYWDWALDSQDLSASPIWDSTHGFGGNGDVDGPEILHGGRCVVNGPFANTTRAWSALSKGHSHDAAHSPHCLSRGFASAHTASTAELKTLHRLISPGHVRKTLAQPDYPSFFEEFEAGAHNAIPQFIKGDFITFTAPNDPVFFLHHTQVDRLWWLWQQRDPETRLKEFQGPAEDFRFHEDGTSAAAKTDVLPMAGLIPDQRVGDVMDTENGLLCYRY